ncbi:MAG: hypothetical protein P8Y70_06835 [Candidatus Lokiarchaeota archaeon]
MSEQEKTIPEIDEIEDIYLLLTNEEPTPDDEIEAREKLIDKFSALISEDSLEEHRDKLRSIQESLIEWDTLDLWFVETELPKMIKECLNALKPNNKIETERKSKTIEKNEILQGIEKKLGEKIREKTPKKSSVIKQDDIEEIFSKISNQFKGEIDDLKTRIETLQEELNTKEMKLGNSKTIRKIKPLKQPKLKPPEIHIPSIKKAQEKTPKSKKMNSEEILKLKQDESKALAHKNKSEISPPSTEIEKSTLGDEKEMKKEQESTTLEISKTIPPKDKKVSEKESELVKSTELETKEVFPKENFTIKSEPKIDKKKPEKKIEKPKLDIKVEIPKMPSKKQLEDEEGAITPLPLNVIEERKKVPKPPESILRFNENKEITPPPEKPKITTIATESPSKSEMEEKSKSHKLFISKPKVSQVKVEETESKTKKPEAADLFSVFSSQKEKNLQKNKKINEFIPFRSERFAPSSSGRLNFSEDISPSSKDFVSENTTSSFKNGTSSEALTSVEDLPRNKDTLYQELIALEGRRYSLEKRFKTLEKSYQKGSINDMDFKNRGEELKGNLDQITDRITKIRRLIASL